MRLLVALWLGNEVRPLPGTFDQVSYDMLARRLLAGQGFTVAGDWWPATRAGEPTAHWSFLYTGFLALVYGLSGAQPLVARLLQALIVGLLLPLGLYQLGRRVFGDIAGLWAAGLGAFYLYFIYYGAALMTEMFTILALLWLLVLALDLAARPTARRWLAFGLLIGLAALLRQVTLLIAPVLALWLLWRRRSWATAAGLGLAGLVALALILPVTARNWQAFGRFVLLNTNNGYAFFFANHPVHGRNFQGILSEDGPGYRDLIPAELMDLDEAALNDALMVRARDIVAADPWRYLLLSASRVEDYFKFWPAADSAPLSNLARVLSFALYLPFMLYGLWLGRRVPPARLLYLVAAAYTAVHLLSWALIRYRLPVDAILMVFAGLAAEALAQHWHLKRREVAAPAPGQAGGRGGAAGVLSAALPAALTGLAASALIALAAVLVHDPAPAQAAPLAVGERQEASQTATPFLILTQTPGPGAPGGPPPGALPTEAPLDLAPPALPGGEGPGTGAGEAGPEAGGGAGAGSQESGSAPAAAGEAQAEVGPAGLLPVAVDDATLVGMWRRFGSPRAAQSPLARLTDQRPAPWGWAATYVVLAALWLWALWRVWRAIGRLGAAEAAGMAGGRLGAAEAEGMAGGRLARGETGAGTEDGG